MTADVYSRRSAVSVTRSAPEQPADVGGEASAAQPTRSERDPGSSVGRGPGGVRPIAAGSGVDAHDDRRAVRVLHAVATDRSHRHLLDAAQPP